MDHDTIISSYPKSVGKNFNPASYTRYFQGSPLSPSTQLFSSLDQHGSSSNDEDFGDPFHVFDNESELSRNYTCCGIHLRDLHELLEHFEGVHVLALGQDDVGTPQRQFPFNPPPVDVGMLQQSQQSSLAQNQHHDQKSQYAGLYFDMDDVNSTSPSPIPIQSVSPHFLSLALEDTGSPLPLSEDHSSRGHEMPHYDRPATQYLSGPIGVHFSHAGSSVLVPASAGPEEAFKSHTPSTEDDINTIPTELNQHLPSVAATSTSPTSSSVPSSSNRQIVNSPSEEDMDGIETIGYVQPTPTVSKRVEEANDTFVPLGKGNLPMTEADNASFDEDVDSMSTGSNFDSWPLQPAEISIPELKDDASLSDKAISWLRTLFKDSLQYRRLLALKTQLDTAQRLVDILQEILDLSELREPAFRREVVVTLQKFAGSQIYPSSYRIEEPIVLNQKDYMGSGGFGEIFQSQLGGKAVCVKAIRLPDISLGDAFAKQFLKEAILWAQLHHPNIVPFLGFFYYHQRPCLISPWMGCGHINNFLQNNYFVNRYLLVKDITGGLSYLHSWGVVHGDLKGTNILVDEYGRALLTDFGISSVFDAALPHWTSQSTVASKGGSTRWQAPELLDSNDDQDVYNTKATDVYAWACTCYELFTGKVPFHEIPRDATVVVRVTRDGMQPSRPQEDDHAWIVFDLQPGFWNTMESCWAKDPAERPTIVDLLVTPQLVDLRDDRHTQVDLFHDPARYRATKRLQRSTCMIQEISNLLDGKQNGHDSQTLRKTLGSPDQQPSSRPSNTVVAVQGDSEPCSSADDNSPDPAPSELRPHPGTKETSIDSPLIVLYLAPDTSRTAEWSNPTPNSMRYRKEEEGGEPAPPYSDGPVQIIPGIWLGSQDNARDWQGLLERGIKSVLNVAKEIVNLLDANQHPLQKVALSPNFTETAFTRQQIDDPTYLPSNPVTGRPPMHYLKLQWSRGQQDLVHSGFPDAMAFTDAALKRGDGVLIHCESGISRSATLVIALVMRAAAERSPSVPPDVWAHKDMQGAYSYVREKSACVGPNISLLYQLLDYEKVLNETRDELGNIPGEAESDSSASSANSGVGMGVPWRSRYRHFPRRRAASVASNMTNSSARSEDLVDYRSNLDSNPMLHPLLRYDLEENQEETADLMEQKNVEEVAEWLEALFNDGVQYRRLFSLKLPAAQWFVDAFQELLDSTETHEVTLRRNIVVTLQKFAKNDIYPSSYQVSDTIVLEQNQYMGSGGFGDIYRCHPWVGQDVCVKAIRLSNIALGGRFMKQFLKEAVLWAQLAHKNIVPFLGYFCYQKRPCLLSPWMTHGHIIDYLKANPSINRYLLVKDITDGLHYLHSWGIIHGDLKGANVLVDDSSHARLADFGVSAVFEASIPQWTSQSTMASKGGSTRWQAPELLDAVEDDDPHNTTHSDIYAWGCVCYEIFTEKLPFYELSREATVMLRVTRDGLKPSRPLREDDAWTRCGLKKKFWALMMKCWAKIALKRPALKEILAASELSGLVDGRSVEDLERIRVRKRERGVLQSITVQALEQSLRPEAMTEPIASGLPEEAVVK